MDKTKVDDMLIQMIQPKMEEIERRFSAGEGLSGEDINTLLLKSQYNHINHLDSKLNEVTADVASLRGDFNQIEGKFAVLEGKFAGLESKFDVLEGKFELMTNDFKSDMKILEQNLELKMSNAINVNMRWGIALIAFLAGGLKLIDILVT